jgi:hypothetical protein
MQYILYSVLACIYQLDFVLKSVTQPVAVSRKLALEYCVISVVWGGRGQVSVDAVGGSKTTVYWGIFGFCVGVCSGEELVVA